MNNNSSKKVITVIGLILGIFGLSSIIYRKYKKRKGNVSEGEPIKGNAQKSVDEREKEGENIIHVNLNDDCARKTKTQPIAVTFATEDDLIEYTLREILAEDEWRTYDEFIQRFVQTASLRCENTAWIESFPKTNEELNEVLKKYRLLEQFDAQLYNNYVK